MNRKLTIAAAAIILALALTAGVVYAYLQDRVEQSNEFTVGHDSVGVTETFTPPENMRTEEEYTFTKTVTVTNSGNTDQFVRVFMDFSDSGARNIATIVYTKNNAAKEATWSGFLADLPENWTFVPESDPDGAVLGGYFYYMKILAPNSSAPPLMTAVKMDYSGVTDPDQITDFDVIVYTESVQTVETKTGAVYGDGDWRTAWKSFLNPTRTP